MWPFSVGVAAIYKNGVLFVTIRDQGPQQLFVHASTHVQKIGLDRCLYYKLYKENGNIRSDSACVNFWLELD